MPGNLPSRCPIRTGASESVDEGAPQRRRGGLVHPMPELPRPHSALTEGPRAQRFLRPPVRVRRHPVALELARPLGVVLDLDDLPGCHALLALAPLRGPHWRELEGLVLDEVPQPRPSPRPGEPVPYAAHHQLLGVVGLEDLVELGPPEVAPRLLLRLELFRDLVAGLLDERAQLVDADRAPLP